MSDYPHIPFPQPALSFHQRPKQKQESDDHDHDRKRRKKPTRWKSWLYHATFGFWIALIIVLLGGSAWGLSEQAIRGGPTRWNIFLILAAYVALVSLVSVICCL
jgi:cytochrome b561